MVEDKRREAGGRKSVDVEDGKAVKEMVGKAMGVRFLVIKSQKNEK